MTPTQTATIVGLVKKAFPRCQWDPMEWEILTEKVARIDGVDTEQADAVIREFRATHSFPEIKGIVDALYNVRTTRNVGTRSFRNTRVDYYRREMMANGWGHDLSDGEVLAHVCRWWAGKWGENSAIAHCIDVAKDVVDEERAFALVRHVFGDAGCEYIQTLLDDRSRRIREGIERRKKGGARSFIEETMQWC